MKVRNAIIVFFVIGLLSAIVVAGTVYYFEKNTLREILDIAFYVVIAEMAIGGLVIGKSNNAGTPMISQGSPKISLNPDDYNGTNSEENTGSIRFGWVLLISAPIWYGFAYFLYKMLEK